MAETSNTETIRLELELEQDPAESIADWTAVLDSVERITDAACSLLEQHNGGNTDRNGRTPVAQPARVPSRASLRSPMPVEVQARAQALQTRQETVIRQLEEAQLDVARQLQALSAIPGIGAAKIAVYLDVTG